MPPQSIKQPLGRVAVFIFQRVYIIKSPEARFLGQIGQRNSNQYFVESEHGHAAAPEGQGQVASAAVRWGTPPVISFEPANATK